MRKLFTLLYLFISVASFGQEYLAKISDSLIAEGSALYQSEMASWYGTDAFLAQYKNRENVGGYFSYPDNHTDRCVFFSKSDSPKVIGTISFDTAYDVAHARVDLRERDFTPYEHDLYLLRTTALKTINDDDSLFNSYANTNLNLIPLITHGEKKVYVLTGPEQSGVVIFGNDYLLRFNDRDELIAKKRLHQNIIVIHYENTGDTTTPGTMHTHSPETGDFITATDICTLMLYEKMAKWQRHYVISKNDVSIWDCNKNILVLLTRKAWDRINQDQRKRSKN